MSITSNSYGERLEILNSVFDIRLFPRNKYSDSLVSLTSSNIQKTVSRKGDARGLEESALMRVYMRCCCVEWPPPASAKSAHVGVEGNEVADKAAVNA